MNLENDGCALIPRVLDDAECFELQQELGALDAAGRRGLLASPVIAKVAALPKITALIASYLPAAPRAVRAIYFDKSADVNWLVPWHQDLTIAVREKLDVPGFGPWSVKDGVPHVQPPVELLAQMLTVRIHLDDADESNGALRVLPGTHQLGRLCADEIKTQRGRIPEALCAAKAGDVLLMRPLILHASSRSTSNRHRRILHIEYAAFALPGGLVWNDAA
jgi:hypothetical protein